MKVRNVLWVILWHLEFFILGTVLFIFLFHTPLFGNIPIFFYRGIALLIVDSLILLSTIIIIKLLGFRKLFTVRDVILSVVLVFCVNLVFFTHLPVTADRSVTVFLLGYMNNHSEKLLTREEITRVFIEKYVLEQGGMQKRFDEQFASGNIAEEGGGYRITKRGRFVMGVYNLVAGLFELDRRNISP